jgi:hypothetical protein
MAEELALPEQQASQPRRVAHVFANHEIPEFPSGDMHHLRFARMSEALARRGHHVDMILNHLNERSLIDSRLAIVPFRNVCWDDYDVIKTSFHSGFEALLAEGGGDHPFIISKLGSVVGSTATPGMHFAENERKHLFETQKEISRRARCVTVLTDRSAALWQREHGVSVKVLKVPTGVDAQIPPIGPNPYNRLGIDEPIVLCAGNLYAPQIQADVHSLWTRRLNEIGSALRKRGIRLIAMGSGNSEGLDPEAVVHLGKVSNPDYWNWQQHARVGLALAQGPEQDNESSRIYYYLRTSLPVVCERPIPNSNLIEQFGCGAVLQFGVVQELVDAVERLCRASVSRTDVSDILVREHSWDARAAQYDPILADDGNFD